MIAGGNPEHLADHGHGERVGEVGDDIHGVRVLHLVQEPIHDALDVGAHPLDHARGEGLAHQGAQPRVVGRIAEEHRAREAALLALLPVHGGEQGLEGFAPEAGIAQAHDHVVIAREDPEAHGGLVDGVFLAELVIEGIRIGVELGEERIEEDLGRRHGCSPPSAEWVSSRDLGARRLVYSVRGSFAGSARLAATRRPPMPTYMVQASYTTVAWHKLVQRPENRMEALKPVIERLDGHILAWYYSFGDYDVVVIFEVPSNVNAAAVSMAIMGSGAVKDLKTSALMSPDEGFDAMLLAQGAGYRPPGS